MRAPVGLELRDLSWAPRGIPVLRGVNLQASPGEVVGLLGPNGSGKSSVLRAIFRRLRPHGGRVLVGGVDVWQAGGREVARTVSALTQDAPADLELTVSELVALGRIPHLGPGAAPTGKDLSVVADALERCGMVDLRFRQVATLSGGERQRAHLARALAQTPALLLLDEPLNHLDLRHQVDLLRALPGFGPTVLITLHDLDLASLSCDRLVVLSRGEVVATGTPADVVTADLVREVYGVDVVVRHDTAGRPRVELRLEARR